MVPGSALSIAMVARVLGRSGLRGAGGSRAAKVVRAAERHGHGSSALSGNRQNQQPNQERSNQQTHPSTLQQAVSGVQTKPIPATHAPAARLALQLRGFYRHRRERQQIGLHLRYLATDEQQPNWQNWQNRPNWTRG